MKTGPEETQAETRVRSEPSLSPETSMFSEEQPTCECEFEGFACDQSSELFQAHSRALGSD